MSLSLPDSSRHSATPLILVGGIGSGDNSVLDKPYRDPQKTELIGIADNRLVSLEPGRLVQVQTLTIPESGLVVYLKELGWVKVFCQNFKHEVCHDIMHRSDAEQLRQLNRQDFRQIHDSHWQIESFHRVLKQVCNITAVFICVDHKSL